MPQAAPARSGRVQHFALRFRCDTTTQNTTPCASRFFTTSSSSLQRNRNADIALHYCASQQASFCGPVFHNPSAHLLRHHNNASLQQLAPPPRLISIESPAAPSDVYKIAPRSSERLGPHHRQPESHAASAYPSKNKATRQ
jgi:hypothetical protein